MVASIALAAFALRAGLALRRARVVRARPAPTARARHLRFAKPAVVVVTIGFLAGPLSMWWLRDRAPFDTLHALLGTLAAGLFVATGLLGRRLERGGSRAVEAHGRLGLLALLAAAAAAFAGFVLLA
jgi:hypothetical protein